MLKTPTDARAQMYMYTMGPSPSHSIKELLTKPVCAYATWSWTDSHIPYKAPSIQVPPITLCQPHTPVPTIPPSTQGFASAVQMDHICRLWPLMPWPYPNYHNKPVLATNSMTSGSHSYQSQNCVRQGVLWISNKTLSLLTTGKGPHWLQVVATPTGTYI